MRISSVSSTYCFVDVEGRLAQVLRVVVAGAPAGASAIITAAGPHFRAFEPWRGQLDPERAGQPGGPAWAPGLDPGLARAGRFTPQPGQPDGVVVELAIAVDDSLSPGELFRASVTAEAAGERAQAEADVEVREPGWRMLMVPHFHYDPVWWNTQAGYTSGWDELVWAQDRRENFQHSGLTLVEAHLQRARVDPGYKFVLAEVDYLKPFWDLYPDRREEMRALVKAGRLEIVGGTYNEPNTNLTGAETAIRAVVYGLGFQRDVAGADPRSAWQLDVFGHDPQFPGIMASCGLDSAAWARGPFHQWGPRKETGSNRWMQFPSEFEWVAPNGRGLLTSYMPNHYSSGWELEGATTLEGSMWRAYELFCDLADVAATRVTLLPVGTDYTPPGRFVTELAAAWGSRYVWPRFEVGIPREFFAAVRAELDQRGQAASPQSRDMNPVYTGKDVSFIDTKQAQRLAETRLAEAEAMAAITSLLGEPVPYRAFDKAWRQLVFGAHHDGITGSESDQVYLDLLGGWRESFELARDVEAHCRRRLVDAVDTNGEGDAVVVSNTLGWDRSDLTWVEVPLPADGAAPEVTDSEGAALAGITGPGASPATVRLEFLAPAVPGVGYRTFRLRSRQRAAGDEGWAEAHGLVISNEHFEVAADPQRGGGLSRVTEKSSGFELVPAGELANELVVYPEYPNHPRFGEGPWNLLPCGPPSRSRSRAARARRETSVLGERLVVEGQVGLGPGTAGDGSKEGFRYRQVTTLWHGARRVELRTEIHDWVSKDHLVRLRFPTTLTGATPVSAVGDAVVARGFGLIDVDAAEAPWTLDNPAAEWFGLSTSLVVEASEGGAAYHRRSVGVVELVTPRGEGSAPWARELVVALVQKGVTATCSEAQRNRYGALFGDSNLPDFRVAVGRPEDNEFVAAVLESGGPAYRAELSDQLNRRGWARLLVPAERPLAERWRPNADLRDTRALPVLVVAGADQAATGSAARALAVEVATGRVVVAQPQALVPHPEEVPGWTAAILNRGTPGFAVDSSGALNVSLLRACSGWPSGVWIDPPRRSAPDGSAFELEHWSHVFEHALLVGRGDWREAGCVDEALAYNRPLVATLAEPHPGLLPAQARLFSVSTSRSAAGEPVGKGVLATMKPAGNPLATSEPNFAEVRPKDDVQISLRFYEAHGQPVEVSVRSLFDLREAQAANLLEEPEEPSSSLVSEAGRAMKLSLGAGELATARLHFSPFQGLAGGEGGATGPGDQARAHEVAGREIAQPVFSRYWLHNKGAAPLGNQALAVHVLSTSLVVRAGDDGKLTAQVSSGCARGTQAGQLELVVPPGWEVDPPNRLFSLSPGAFLQVPVRFRAPEGWRPGRSFLAARVVDTEGQAQEDVVTVDVLPRLAEATALDGGPAVPGLGAAGEGPRPLQVLATPRSFGHPSTQVGAELEATVEQQELVVPAGITMKLGLRLANRTAGELRAEVQLLSPVETWPWVGPWVQGAVIPAHSESTVEVTVQGLPTGWLSTWAAFKVTYFGRLWYSPSVSLRLGNDPSQDQALVLAAAEHA